MARRGGGASRPPLPLLGALLVLLFLAAAPSSSRGGAFPASSTGDIWFQVDHAGFLGDDDQIMEEYYVRVAHDQLRFEEDDSAWVGRVYVRFTFYDADDNDLGQAGQEFRFQAADEEASLSPDRVQLLVIREQLDPRTRAVQVEMEDLNARKRGLIYLLTKKPRNGTVRASLLPPPFPGRDFALSDIQFAWAVEPETPDSRFAKNGFNVIPNPPRSYGLYRDTLSVYYEVYDRQDQPGGVFYLEQSILDDQGRVAVSSRDTVAVEGKRWAHTPSLPIRGIPAGTYDFRVSVRPFGADSAAAASRPFNVVWNEGSWASTEEDILDEARVLLTDDEYEKFKEMQPGDRETFLAGFWNSHDPTPGTARNEQRELFLSRVDYANRNFSTPFEKGLSSDRGRIHIRYGEPDEITREVMPQMGSSLTDMLNGADEQRPELSRLKSNTVDTRPYEIWTYTRIGNPLFPDREATTPNGLTFIFVDDQGIGNYILRYSSSFNRY